MNIYQRIAAVAKQVTYIKKDANVGWGNQTYKAVTHDQVTGKLRAAMLEHGVLAIPSVVGDTSMTHVGETKSGTPIYRYAARYDVQFINIEQPDDKTSAIVDAHADDHGDKAPGKAMSYAVKTAMLKVFLLETGENDEARYQDSELTRRMQMPDPSMLPETLRDWYRDSAPNAPEAHVKAVIANAESIAAIKIHLECDEMPQAAEAWFELGHELGPERLKDLWVAPSKGGVFTTSQRETMKGKEFREAHYGPVGTTEESEAA